MTGWSRRRPGRSRQFAEQVRQESAFWERKVRELDLKME